MKTAESDKPYRLFGAWFDKACKTEPENPNAMTVATVDAAGRPHARMVLLKDWGADGFVFYTNTDSPKGTDLAANPRAALLFYWKTLGRQVRIEGAVAPVSHKEADAYFATRPRGAQIGAWASKQSAPLAGRFELEKRVMEVAARFGTGDVTRPPNWSGYRVTAERIEFWRQGMFRLHRRQLFTALDDGCWQVDLLYP